MVRKIVTGLFIIAAAASGALGCAHVDVASHMNRQAPLPVAVPRIKIDEPASLMALKYLSAADVPKLDVVRGLDEFWNKTSVTLDGNAIPARMIIEAKSAGQRSWNALVSNELIALMTGGALFLFGVPTAWDTEMVTFTLEMDGHEYRATAQAKCFAGLYYPGDPGPCAFSRALTEAVRQVSRQVAEAYINVIQQPPPVLPVSNEPGVGGVGDGGILKIEVVE